MALLIFRIACRLHRAVHAWPVDPRRAVLQRHVVLGRFRDTEASHVLLKIAAAALVDLELHIAGSASRSYGKVRKGYTMKCLTRHDVL